MPLTKSVTNSFVQFTECDWRRCLSHTNMAGGTVGKYDWWWRLCGGGGGFVAAALVTNGHPIFICNAITAEGCVGGTMQYVHRSVCEL